MTDDMKILRFPAGPLHAVALLVLVVHALGCTESTNPAEPQRSATAQQVHDALAIEDRLAGIEELARLLQALPRTPEVASEVVAGFDESMTDRGDIELVLVAEWWTPFDPEAALEWSLKSWRAEHPRITYAVLRTMARQDAQAAVDAYHSLPVTEESFAFYLQPVLVGWYESQAPGLVPFIVSHPSTKLQQLSLGTLARLQVLNIGPQKSIEWAERISEGKSETFTRHIFQRIASSIAEVDPETAAHWVEDLVLNQQASETLLRRVSGRWARREPEAAFEWLGRFPASRDQQQAVSQTFAIWLARDPQAAKTWLLDQGDKIGTSYGSATRALVRTRAGVAKNNPDDAIDWEESLALALRIDDEAMRWGAVTELCRVWITRDEAATNQWVEAHSVPENYVVKIRGALERKDSMKPRA